MTRRTGPLTRRFSVLAPALVLGLFLAAGLHSRPDAASVSLVKVETAHTVDFESGVVWLLLLGSDARSGTEILDGNSDGIQLVGVDFDTGSAVAFGVPRDSWVELEGYGMDRINAGLREGGPELMAGAVEELFGVAPDYVVTLGTRGLSKLVDSVGGIEVDSVRDISGPALGLDIRKGRNRIDGSEAIGFARARYKLPRGDFDRSANHQEMMRGVVRQLAAHKDDIGFIEANVLRALGVLDTNLGPNELYRLTQAVAEIDLAQVTTCVLGGTPGTSSGGASIVYVDTAQARRLGRDAADDARLDATCRG